MYHESVVKERPSERTRENELKEIQAYQKLVKWVNAKVEEKAYTPALLEDTSKLLNKNPELYTTWNHRQRIYMNEFDRLREATADGNVDEEEKSRNILDIIQLDLQFLFPLLVQFPKCYWIWNHRLWLLDESTLLLPVHHSRALWSQEFVLVGKMLDRDSRNFHGWNYRRTVVRNLESQKLSGRSMARTELEYTESMIRSNLSNFSAWHNRSNLILRILNEENTSNEERKKMLDQELNFIHEALFDPYDQSLWLYHQKLMRNFDPDPPHEKQIASNLSNDQREKYVTIERHFVEEILEDNVDCKWVYQTLFDLALLEAKLVGQISEYTKSQMVLWIEHLQALDPLRKGRWVDITQSLHK